MQVQSYPIHNPDNTKNQIQVFSPSRISASDEGKIILIFPAMGVYSSYYSQLALALVDHNYVAICTDLRGNGQSSVRPSRQVDFGYADSLKMDYNSVIQKVAELYPNKSIYLLGHSLGGQLGCLYMGRYPKQLKGLILIASCSVYYKAWQGVARLHLVVGTQFLRFVSWVLGYLPGKQLGFGGLEAKDIIHDWSRQALSGQYQPKGDNFDYEAALQQVEKPCLAISFEGDKLCPKAAVAHLYQKLGSYHKGQVQHLHLERKHPLNNNFGHFNWAKDPQNIIQIITQWIDKN